MEALGGRWNRRAMRKDVGTEMDLPRFYIVGLLPVKFLRAPDGAMVVLKMSWETR